MLRCAVHGAPVWYFKGISRSMGPAAAARYAPRPHRCHCAQAAGCADDYGCSLNGVCTVAAGTCACDVGWAGDDCGLLDLLPTVAGNGYRAAGAAGGELGC